MIKKLASFAGLGLLLLGGATTDAAAATTQGYVCVATVYGSTSSSENPYGQTSFSLYSGPACTGSYLKSLTVCSTTTHGAFCFTREPYTRISEIVTDAAANDTPVKFQDGAPFAPNNVFSATVRH